MHVSCLVGITMVVERSPEPGLKLTAITKVEALLLISLTARVSKMNFVHGLFACYDLIVIMSCR